MMGQPPNQVSQQYQPHPQAPAAPPQRPVTPAHSDDFETFEPQSKQQRETPAADYYSYGSISLEPIDKQHPADISQNDQMATFDPAHTPLQSSGFDSSGKTDLDLEIERYQREIEEKQHHGGGGRGSEQPAAQAYSSPPPQQQHTSPAQQPEQDYDVYNMDSPSFEVSAPHSSQQTPAQQQQPMQPMIGDGEDEAMFFTSIDRDRQKKPIKRPVNPRTQQQQKGFLSKFFNKDMS
jgi:hypothetical protein